MDGATLIVVTALKGVPRPNRKILLTRKFVDGMSIYRDLWRGPIILFCEPSSKASDNLDNFEIDLDHAPFETVCESFFDDRFERLLTRSSLVIARVGEHFNTISQLCRNKGAACVYLTENSLRNRIEIVREYQKTPIHGLWGSWKQIAQERSQVRAISLANGVQCNGTPTYTAYEHLTPMPHLFFDTRFKETALPTSNDISKRLDRFKDDNVLRLAFSGRLTLIKGADHLPILADNLRKFGIKFEMSIFGDGELKQSMQNKVTSLGLDNSVKFRGILDFDNELVPLIKTETDLFVCCHRQGDPSCTYLETMGCGVPIVAYANEAFQGLVETSNVGWATPVGKPLELAKRIASICRDPATLRNASLRSLEFASEHTFEKTFKRRVDHLDRVMEASIRREN